MLVGFYKVSNVSGGTSIKLQRRNNQKPPACLVRTCNGHIGDIYYFDTHTHTGADLMFVLVSVLNFLQRMFRMLFVHCSACIAFGLPPGFHPRCMHTSPCHYMILHGHLVSTCGKCLKVPIKNNRQKFRGQTGILTPTRMCALRFTVFCASIF